MKKFLTCSLLGLAILPQAFSALPNRVLYGQDDRRDFYEIHDRVWEELARSTAAMISNSNIQRYGQSQAKYLIKGKTLNQYGVCEGERFGDQTTAASCSGFLLGPDTLVTAGHCIKSTADCNSYKWVFDYKLDSPTQKQVVVDNTNIYTCTQLVGHALSADGNDYAVVKLDRRVNDRAPLKFRKSGKIAVGTPVVMIGHPTGLPLKLADNAKVRSLQGFHFVANTDSFGGNSGSAIFNAITKEVEGILVRGDNDYVTNSQRGCASPNKLPDNGGRGEDITYITNVKQLYYR